MSAPPRERIRARNRRNVLVRHHGADSPQVAEADRELRYFTLAELITATVDEMPPLSADQRSRLAVLLLAGVDEPHRADRPHRAEAA